MSQIRRRGRRRARGQTLTEFALILPVFLMMTLVVVDGARVYMAQIALTNGVREAALFAVKGNYNSWCRNPSSSAQKDPSMPVSVTCPTGVTSLNYGADPGNLAYRIAVEAGGMTLPNIVMAQPKCGLGPGAPATSCNSVANPKFVTVSATYRFSPLTPMLAQIWGNSIVLSASTTGRVDM
jgi:Flp pilus assembly protein TadG